MGKVRKIPLTTKILLLTLCVTFGIATISVSIMIRNDLAQYKSVVNLFNDIIESSSAISSNMIDNDSQAMLDNLQKLKLNPNIVSTEVYRFDGQKFSKVFSSPETGQSGIKKMEPLNTEFTFLNQKLEIMYPIMQHNNVIGAIYIKTLISTNYVFSIIEVIVLKTLIAVFFAVFLSSLMTKPIKSLVAAMQSVTDQNDYSIRVKHKNEHKVDNITTAFNRMLASIQQQERTERSSQEQLKRLVYYNSVTGLPNLDLFKELLQHVLINAKRHNQIFALFSLSIDNFANLNMVFGSDKSHAFLRMIAHNLQEKSQHVSNLAHIAEDKFIMCVQHVKNVAEIETIANSTLGLVSQPCVIDTEQIKATASIGISIYPEHGDKNETLIKNAESAMYLCKEVGGGNYRIFDNVARSASKNDLLEQKLQNAYAQNEFVTFYQPKLNLKTKHIDGVELSAYWRDSTTGKLILPNEFIPIAERTGLIIDLGYMMLKDGCKQCKKWQDNGISDMQVSIKLTKQQLADPDLLAHLKLALLQSGLAPKFLELELTVSMIMTNDAETHSILSALKALGIKLAIADFGSGYLSLRYLTQYSIDAIKIDQFFISHLKENINYASLTRAIINLAHNLNFKVVANGVETKEQLEYLNRYDCDFVQGYLIGKPISASEMTNFLKKHEGGIYAA